MRIAFFGSAGAMSLLPLQALAEDHELVAVVRAGASRRILGRLAAAVAAGFGRRHHDALSLWARTRGVPSYLSRSGCDPELAARLRDLAPDLLCVSAFRYVLAPELLSIPRLGALNLHPSLLPRHRGPVPWFWVYYRDDSATGVTVHWMDRRVDEGDILAQESFPLPRGMSVDRLGEQSARLGARLLRDAVALVASGRATRTPQDGTLATSAPPVKPGVPMVDFAAWGAERVWHFLAGLHPRFREPLRDRNERGVEYEGVLGYELGSPRSPVGLVCRNEARLALHCRDGVVWLTAVPAGVEAE